MEYANNVIIPRPLLPHEPLKEAVYCSDCEILKQDRIGSKSGLCMDHPIEDVNTPMKCAYYKNAHSIVSILMFQKDSGLPLYNRAIVKDFDKQFDPGLLSSFLQAISSFGMELANEQISQIQFQKMKILYCRGDYVNGALILRGKFDPEAELVFYNLIKKVEDKFPNYFTGILSNSCLPEEEVDALCFESLHEYVKGKLYPVQNKKIEKACKAGCSLHLHHKGKRKCK